MMKERYRRYRSYGHPPLVAAILAPDIVSVWIVAAVVGLIMGMTL